jgi:ribosome-interacting GTPase 1
MPANLPPQYQKAEEEYRKAQSAAERFEILERMLVLIPKHKGTEKLQADLKTKLKETKADIQVEKTAPKGGKVYRFPRQGAAQVILIGGPNSGKSRILRDLTKAEPEVADYPFTTREPMPGMMAWEDVTVQLIDTPPITDSLFEPYLLNFVRSADLVVLTFDGASDDSPEATATVIDQFRQRATALFTTTGFDEDDFSKLNVKTLLVVTRGRHSEVRDRLDFFREMVPTAFATVHVDLDQTPDRELLRQSIFEGLGLIRLYTKAPGKPADFSSPFTIPIGGTVEDLASKVHRDLADKLKFAKIWGTSAADGQSVGRDHVLADKDLVELHT